MMNTCHCGFGLDASLACITRPLFQRSIIGRFFNIGNPSVFSGSSPLSLHFQSNIQNKLAFASRLYRFLTLPLQKVHPQ